MPRSSRTLSSSKIRVFSRRRNTLPYANTSIKSRIESKQTKKNKGVRQPSLVFPHGTILREEPSFLNLKRSSTSLSMSSLRYLLSKESIYSNGAQVHRRETVEGKRRRLLSFQWFFDLPPFCFHPALKSLVSIFFLFSREHRGRS